MEPNWHSQGFYNYYPPHDPSRPADAPPPHRNNASPINQAPAAPPTHQSPSNSTHNSEDHTSHRRAATHPQHFLPPPPPPHTNPASSTASTGPGSSSSSTMHLPPFTSTFYPSHYHQSHAGIPGPYSSHPLIHASPSNPYGSHGYPLTSPVGMPGPPISGSRQPPPHSYTESPRMAAGHASTAYSSSPGIHHLSPTSPTMHLPPPGMTNSSTSSVSLPKAKRRSGSGGESESWDDEANMSGGGRKRGHLSGGDESGMGLDMLGEDDFDESQPWGMPQEEYKALNPRDKKQVRNRIGARRFRAKRKDYVSSLEGNLRHREDEIAALRAQVESHRGEINDLRSRLGMPMLGPPLVAGNGALGLVVGGGVSSNGQDAGVDRGELPTVGSAPYGKE